MVSKLVLRGFSLFRQFALVVNKSLTVFTFICALEDQISKEKIERGL